MSSAWTRLRYRRILGFLYARRFESSGGALRLYSIASCIALLAVAVVFAVLAATSEPDQRGGFIGLAILWFAMAGEAM